MRYWFKLLARVALALALVVVTLGAWVRLSDAGLGCPDWPGCYGRLVVSAEIASDPAAANLLDARPLESGKAWREMIHRYVASTLGLLCVALAVIAWLNRRDPGQPVAAPFALVGLVIFQGLLGMWTVTLLLKPIVVVGHLLGGLATLGLLFWLAHFDRPRITVPAPIRTLGIAAAIALAFQIFLGGWTSANYAALACPDFPTCQTEWWPRIADFNEAFVVWRGVGIDYEGGVLDHPARVAIHFTHRLGAVIASLLIAVFAVKLVADGRTRKAGAALLGALVLQVSIGISVVIFGVPLYVAVAHNGVAALLLLALINAHQRISQD
jgi:cytochrome c oxidase assembly protein subunit 15